MLIGLIPLFPLAGFIINGLVGKKISKSASGIIACGAILAAFIFAAVSFLQMKNSGGNGITVHWFNWIESGNFEVPFALLFDPLSGLFTLIITGVGFLIHVYSTAYMKEDEGFSRFFTYLNLFVFFMLLLVLGNNYTIMFVGWEGVGLCSYLLIGFWFKNHEYNLAANKAFVMNRIGDLGFLLGMILMYVTFGSTAFSEVFNRVPVAKESAVTAISLLLFIGAMGKSAQIPLYTWLPDAMAGPTPVSALIHAATMVTAGVYMVVRSNIFYSVSHTASLVVAVVGACSALLAATIGLLQNDIKKILAYSTVSQLGLMFLALGAGAYSSAVFHVTTHAFFKALLFLGAGSVIHALHHEQDIRKMGGLKKSLPVTFLTMLIGTIAISGVPPLSGFFSKDEMLGRVYEYSPALWFIGSLTSMLTAFYMFRMMLLVFWGNFRGSKEQKHHLHESPKAMTIPLIILAVLAALGGCLGLPEAFGFSNWMQENLDPLILRKNPSILSHATEYRLMGIAVLAALSVIYFAWMLYVKNNVLPAKSENELKGWQKIIANKFYVDELYDKLFKKPLDLLSQALHLFFDIQLLNGIVDGFGDLVRFIAVQIRKLQTGHIGYYLAVMVIGLIVLIFTGMKI